MRSLILAVSGLAFGLTACSSSTSAPGVEPVQVASVSVTLPASTLTVGQTQMGAATPRDASGAPLSDRSVTWQSSVPGVAAVAADGMVSAIAAGTTMISASSNGVSGSAALTVNAAPPGPPAPVATVSVSLSASSIVAGQTGTATATPRDANGNALSGRVVTWQSSNTNVATVSAAGAISAVAAGSATITATSETKSGSASLTVTANASGLSPSVFSDDFETGNFSKWNESNSSVQQIINNPASAHSGNYFVRLTYGIGGQDAGWMNKYFNQGFRQLYVRYYVRFSANFVGGTKLVGFHGAPIGNPSAGVGRAGICPNGSDSFASLLVTAIGTGETFPHKMYTYWQDMWADSDGKCWGRYGATPSTMPYVSPMPQFTKNVWHKVEYTIKMNSAANVADGEQRFWVDGVKYGEWKGIRFGDPTRINIGVLIISGSGDTGQVQSADYDDLILTPDYPAQSQP